MSIICLITGIIVFIMIFFDLKKKIHLTNKGFMSIFLIVSPHSVSLSYMFMNYATKYTFPFILQDIFIVEISLLTLYIWIKLHIAPYIHKERISLRLNILRGGRSLIFYGLFVSIMQILVYCFMLKLFNQLPTPIIILDTTLTVLFILSLLINGYIRIILTSHRLNILQKVLILLFIFLPAINIILLLYMCHLSKTEYDHECYKVTIYPERNTSFVCQTKYPIVLIHGVGFRDLKYLNYWGRIPKELIKNGACIYYGHQEAWGTIEDNAHQIKEKILDIINETGCKKVNIIAHSKGGLDARYMVSKLDMSNYVASLTTISSPHHGSKAIDMLLHLPEGIYRFITKLIDKYFKMIGDKNPDSYTASRQFSTKHAKVFNKEVTDAAGVYYQSYTSIMKSPFSDLLLAFPYLIIRLIEGKNDGLVSIDSSKWGEFRGVLKNKYSTGVSHGDIIDLKRQDYKGFDVREFYIQVVSELKDKGY